MNIFCTAGEWSNNSSQTFRKAWFSTLQFQEGEKKYSWNLNVKSSENAKIFFFTEIQ